ncbi:HypC/HybG/HupF family hydrogenase formation chaperone [Clostridium sp. SYSU_GA19001]|uniref:HypC/HybG/HupF family hydrogenase formation chaperone n=1 Tax=Clostridium caldaquaticum TaxID=2940653 RepID=UPI0020771AD8|nr:HypC/HybG/HupF family hydrogenase formation chaperone [Clostridium caldaquaticum]MCM8712128.1 HypC/HybG/HupF family hydrogenase formation chaperone [Clostridium caldaquaticum]
MCLAIPGEIIDIKGNAAKVNIMGVESEINIQLIESPKAGDYILVHAGCAIQKIDTDYYDYLQEVFQSMLEVKKENEQTGFN